MRFIKFLLILFLFLFCLLFFTQNKEALSLDIPLKVDLFFANLQWEGMKVPYYFVALGCLAAGMFFASLFFLIDRIKLSYAIIEKKIKLSRFESDVKRLNEQLESERKEVAKAKEMASKAKEEAEAQVENKLQAMRKDIELTVKKEAGLIENEPESKGVFGLFRKG